MQRGIDPIIPDNPPEFAIAHAVLGGQANLSAECTNRKRRAEKVVQPKDLWHASGALCTAYSPERPYSLIP